MVLGRIKGVEDLAQLIVGDAGSRIGYRHLNARTGNRGGVNDKQAVARCNVGHGIHAIAGEVQDHLLEVNRIGSHRQGPLVASAAQRNVSLPRFGCKNVRGIDNDLVEVELLQFEVVPALDQVAKVPNDVDSVL